jgi:N-acetylglucosamine transport system permease protein
MDTPSVDRTRAAPALPAAAETRIRLSRVLATGLMQVVLLGWTAIVVFPLVWLLYSSLKTDREIFFSPWSLPATVQWDNFARAWTKAHIGRYFGNSLTVVVPSLILTLLTSAMAAYVLARFTFPGSRAVLYLFIGGMMFPVFLGLVPLFFLLQRLRLLNSFTGLVLVYIGYSLPFTIFFLTGFFKTLPSELHEAAVIDGANQYEIFFQIMLPLAQPGLVTVGIFNVLGMWNQFILPLVLMSDSRRYLLTQGLAYMLHQQYYLNDWSGLFAAVVLVMVPTLMVYAVFQGRIQKGLTVGALKG